ncbi:MAG: type II secretion system minor pseudopilin GspH [Casimicrobiaceae bacterium]
MGSLNRRRPRRVTSGTQRRGAGFTLIELLVVLAIIGLVSGIVALSVGGDERRTTEREAKRLAGALEHAAATAQWRAQTLGVSAEGGGYRFWRRNADDRWSVLTDDDVLAPRTLPAGITATPVAYAGAPVPPDAILPFRASGRNEPFTLEIASSAWSLQVDADPLNRVHLAAPADSR